MTRTRVLTAALLAPLVLVALCWPGGVPFYCLLGVVGFLALVELERLTKGRGLLLLFGVVALYFLFSSLYGIRTTTSPSLDLPYGIESGAGWLVILLLSIWAGDTAAYFVGRALGRHKMSPSISPNKTWEGAIANLVACIIIATLLCLYAHRPSWVGPALGLTAGVLGQVGDLIESAIKRSAGVKDSGALFPGHGGVLDRIDSLFLTVPAAWVILVLARLSSSANS